MLDLDVRLMSDLGAGLGLMPSLDAGLRRRRRFSVISRRPIGGAQSDIRIWGWGLGLESGAGV